MKVYIDSESKIRSVGTTTDTSLIEVFIDETADSFPFKGWSIAKICCYKVTVVNGIVTMMTPYVDSRNLDFIDQMGHGIDNITPYEAKEIASMGDTEVVFIDVPEGVNLTTVVKDLEGHFIEHNTTKSEDIVTVTFEPLQYAADIFLSVN